MLHWAKIFLKNVNKQLISANFFSKMSKSGKHFYKKQSSQTDYFCLSVRGTLKTSVCFDLPCMFRDFVELGT